MTLRLHHLVILLASLLPWTEAAPAADSEPQQGYGYRNRMSAYTYSQPPVSYSSNQAVYPATYSYPQYHYSNNYPVYQTYPSKPSFSTSWYSPSSSSSYPSSTYPVYSPSSYQHQQPQYQMSYMLNDLTYPATFSSSPSSSSSSSSATSNSASSRSFSSSVSSSPAIVSSRQEQSPAWQGKVKGAAHTKCHDGTLLPFRARCNKVPECSGGEDEYDCEWYKKSSIPSIDSFQEFTNVLNQNEKVLVEFFAPWCPACVTFLPVLEDIDQTLHYENENLAVYKVNTDENQDLKAMFNVNTFPRVLLFDKKKGVEPKMYEKAFGMKFQPLYNWLKKELND